MSTTDDRFSLVTNPEFQTVKGYPYQEGEPIENYQELDSEEVEFLSQMAPTPDSWQGSGKVPGIHPEKHVKYPVGAGQDLVESDPAPLEPGNPVRSFKQPLARVFERRAEVGTDCTICEPETSESSNPSETEDTASHKSQWKAEASSSKYGGRKFSVPYSTEPAPSQVEAFPKTMDGDVEKLQVLQGISADFEEEEAAALAEHLVQCEHRPVESIAVDGYSLIPGECYPVDSRSLDRLTGGIPQHYDELDEKGNVKSTIATYSLYSSPLRSDKSLDLTNPKVVQEQFLKRTKTGRYYTPRGTLYKILKATCGIQKIEPGKKLTEREKKRAMGERAYLACKKNGTENFSGESGSRTMLRIESIRMLTPTDVPALAHRPWLSALSIGDCHGSSPEEFFLCIIAQINYFHRFWEEQQDEDGQRYLKIKFPGRDSGTFALSIGAPRQDQCVWKVKKCARQALSILCGAGIPKTSQQASKLKLTDRRFREITVMRNERVLPLVSDNSEGSDAATKQLAPEYRPESLVGHHQRIPEEEDVPYTWIE